MSSRTLQQREVVAKTQALIWVFGVKDCLFRCKATLQPQSDLKIRRKTHIGSWILVNLSSQSIHLLLSLGLSVHTETVTLANMHYSISIWHRCTYSPVSLPRKTTCNHQPMHLAQTLHGKSASATGRAQTFFFFFVWLRDSFLFGLCNIDVRLQQVGRHFHGGFNFLVYKSFSSLSVGQVRFDLFASLGENK